MTRRRRSRTSARGALAMLTAALTVLAAVTASPVRGPSFATARADDDGDDEGGGDEGGGGDDAGDDGAELPDAGEAAPEVSVAVVVASARGAPLAAATHATVQVSMERALERDPRLLVIDQDDRLAMRAGRVPKVDVAEARDLTDLGEKLLEDGKGKDAAARLQVAVTKLERVLAWAPKQQFARAQMLLGTAQAMAGDAEAARATFAALQVWRPDAAPDPELAGDRTMTAWEEAQAEVAARERGTVDIDSTPDGALAYVDGKLVGFTPTLVEGLVAGTHYVTLRRDGFERRVEAVVVDAARPVNLAVSLTPSEKARELASAEATFAAGAADVAVGDELDGVEPTDEVRTALATIGQLVDVDQVVLVVPGKKDHYAVSIHATDGGARLAAMDVKVGARDLETAFADAATSLYEEVASGIVVVPVRPRPRPPADEKYRPQLYKKWWFWAAVAGGAVTILTISVMASGDDGPAGCPDGSSCGTVIFRF